MTSLNRSELDKDKLSVRLQKLLSEAGIASRRACEELITQGRVRVNGVVIDKLGSKAIPEVDQVTVDGVPIRLPQKVLYLFHKPRGVITSMFDPEGRVCVGNYAENLARRVFPVGRLDYNVSGLLLLTNDGDFAQKISHPQYGTKRKYLARVKGVLTQQRARLLQHGVTLEDGFGRLDSVSEISSSVYSENLIGTLKNEESLLEVVVEEGRNHFVKNILESVGLPVNKLSRIEFGPFRLGNIKSGQMRQIALKQELLG
jgi:23S rRNA pseudouridine2605 synthase